MARQSKFKAKVTSFEEVSESLRLIDRHLRALDAWLQLHAAECAAVRPDRRARRPSKPKHAPRVKA